MYSEYTTHFTHNIQFVYPVYNLYCILHTDYTDSQLYVDYIFHYMYRMCVKINVLYVQCAVYILIGWQAYRGDQIHRKNSPT